MQPTRQQRRRLRRNAEPVAAVLAASALESDGGMRPITDATARKVLRDGFAEMIRNNCNPVVQRITHAQAASLPGYRPTPPGAQWWAAFGLDVDGRGTWITCWAAFSDLPPEEARDLIEVRLLQDLARAANVSGLTQEAAR